MLVEHKENIVAAARGSGLPPAFVAGVISRESNSGATLRNGWGDNGNAFGVMQVDKRHHKPDVNDGSFGSRHLRQGCEILKKSYDAVKAKHPTWSEEQLLQGAAVGYNSGAGNVRTVEGMDRGTAGNNYGSDVLNRAKGLEGEFGRLLKSNK